MPENPTGNTRGEGGEEARAGEEESTEVEDRGEDSADKVGTRGAGDVRSTRV